MDRRKVIIAQRRSALVNMNNILFDNARPQTAILTRQKLRELSLEAVIRPYLSPRLAPSDYNAVLSKATDFSGQKCAPEKLVKIDPQCFKNNFQIF